MKMKKIRGGGGDQGGCVQRMEVIVKRKKNEENKTLRTLGRVGEAFEKIKNNFFYFLFFFGGGGGGCRVRVRELKGEVKLL